MPYINLSLKLLATATISAFLIASFPSILSFGIYKKIKSRFYNDISESIRQTTQKQPYCLIQPIFLGNNRVIWVVDNNANKIDLWNIISHSIRYKLLFYNQGVGEKSLRRRAFYGREIHFGLLTPVNFYLWSFKENKFISTPELMLSWQKRIKALGYTLKLKEHYYHLYKSIPLPKPSQLKADCSFAFE